VRHLAIRREALEDAVAKAAALQQQKMGPLAGGLGLPGMG